MTTEKHNNSLPQTDVEDSISVHAKMDPEDQEQKERASESPFGHHESPEWKAAERRVVRKLDMTLMPMVWILYMFNYLDRNNIAYRGCHELLWPHRSPFLPWYCGSPVLSYVSHRDLICQSAVDGADC
ncbi:major facilitator superfamily transporter [Ilyonectria robusta]